MSIGTLIIDSIEVESLRWHGTKVGCLKKILKWILSQRRTRGWPRRTWKDGITSIMTEKGLTSQREIHNSETRLR